MGEKVIFEVVVGTYEQFVLGYQFVKCEEGKKFNFSFANHSHQGTVKSLATCDKWLASSSSDETIRLYDMFTRKESGLLMEQNGTISCICFTPDASHLISASEDGSIAIFKTGSWQLEKVWNSAHKGSSVTFIAVHPTGKLALSLGKDLTLRTWNLVKGRPAYTTNLSRCKTQLEYIVWSPSGDYYAIPMNTTLELFSVNTGGVSQVFKFKSRVTCAIFLNDKVLCVGEDSGEVSGQCTETGLELWTITSGEKRVRGIAVYKKYLITGCSNGTVAAYKIPSPAETPSLITTINADCRITCLTIYTPHERKMKRETVHNEEMKTKGLNDTSNCLNDFKKGIVVSDIKSPTANGQDKSHSSVKCIPRDQNWDVKKIKRVKR